MSFWSRVRGNVIKWWQQVVLPVLHINNDATGAARFRPAGTPLSEEEPTDTPYEANEPVTESDAAAKAVQQEAPGDAMEVLNRINREKEEKRRQEVELARKEQDEKARIDSIMNSNKVDVNSFIAAGKAAVEETRHEDDMRRAQEIMNRLNQEAAEDEAKKLAEVEAARKTAEEHFG